MGPNAFEFFLHEFADAEGVPDWLLDLGLRGSQAFVDLPSHWTELTQTPTLELSGITLPSTWI
jgi:hypothetical protein